jgi:uncharacterized membrane protein
MEARVAAAGQGWQWIVDGFALFRKIPLMWIALSVVLVLLWMVSFVIPVIGPLLFNLLSPVLFAGLMLGCKAVENGEDLEISHLFAGFQKHAVPLVTVGGVYLVGTIVILGIVLATAGGSMLPTVLSKSQADLQTLSAVVRSMVLALSVALLFYIPLIMLIWFAPVLVALHNLAPVEAMKLSFRACWINMMPFLVYGLAVMVLWFIASIPLLLGLVVLVPVLICSVYASYRDIFNPGSAPRNSSNPMLD